MSDSDHLTGLEAVLPDDRANVSNILRVLKALKLCVSWSVTPTQGVYEIIGMVDSKRDSEISLTDLDTLQLVDRLRVIHVGVKLNQTTHAHCVRIKLLAHSQPVMLEVHEIERVTRKRRWWGGDR